ncbi:MAG: adenylosuccinate lyase [Candidatus Thermoplasmatota archaeon]|nr:adenylosuccinate lyase [Candidatus Thermoplasmatota archaeon]
MEVCPLDFRYGRDEMKAIFSEESRLQALLDVEAALAWAHAGVGNIPGKDAVAIQNAAKVKIVSVDAVKKEEEKTKHDIAALVRVLAKKSGPSGAYVHLGATSSDINDTATALQMKEVIRILNKNLRDLKKIFVDLAKKHKDTVMLGRTHGLAAVPITFGLKMAVFAAETNRHIRRLKQCMPRICVGKMLGAVGTGASLGKGALIIQKRMMEELELGVEEGPTQIVGRDRYVEFISVLAGIATSMEKFATEVRSLQRTEVGEVEEHFGREQLGSSTMAQKRNPITSENICGLARVVRGYIHPTYENVLLWHERDLTNSSAERFIIPHVCILTDDIVAKTAKVYSSLIVNEERMLENIEATKGQAMVEAVMTALVNKGMNRQKAYKLTRKCAGWARKRDEHLLGVLRRDKMVLRYLTGWEIEKTMDPANYLGSSKKIIANIVRKSRG